MTEYQDTLKAESASWVISDPKRRAEKFKRERIRHFKLARDLLLTELGTEDMNVLEVGGGPMPLSNVLRYRARTVVDPLAAEYATVLPCPDHCALKAEDMTFEDQFDLVIATNSLDHVEDPDGVLFRMVQALKPRGYIAIACAENNAITHPHPAHVHNLNAEWVHNRLDGEFETVWSLTYKEHGARYGWVLHEGRRGQPAFCLLMRDCSGS